MDERGEILYLHGRTGQYLEPASGEAGMNIMKMAREGLRRELTTALRKTVALKDPVRHQGLRVKTNGDFATLNLTVRPVYVSTDFTVPPKLFLVIFEQAPAVEPGPPEKAVSMEVGEGPAGNPPTGVLSCL